MAAVGFAALCALALTKAPQLLEPDDYAYRASITALSQGHLLLSTAQYQALAGALGQGAGRGFGLGGGGIAQWVHLADGKWISEKNPGYPFFAVVFQMLGALRLAPLFYGAAGCVGLFFGARRWLGRYGGSFAVLLFCTSGAAITFAWRATMPTFTGASLIAAGAGALLWSMLAGEASRRWRLLAGMAAFLCLEGAAFVRYPDFVELAVAVVAVLAFFRRARLPWQTVAWWMSSVAVFGAGVLAFDTFVYGGPFATGYRPGEIAFSLSAVLPNLEQMPLRLFEAMPMTALGIAAAGWILLRLTAGRRAGRPGAGGERRRDAAVAVALLAGWAGIWAFYSAYNWTVNQVGADPVHVIRFYVPALGLIALLGAWTLARLPWAVSLPAAALALAAGVLSFHSMAAQNAAGPRPGPGGARLPGQIAPGPGRVGHRPGGPPGGGFGGPQ